MSHAFGPRDLIALTATLGAIAAGSPAAPAAPGTGAIASFGSQPNPPVFAAGAIAHNSDAIHFKYATRDDSVKDLSIAFPPGFNIAPADVSATCTAAELSADRCPASSLIGDGVGTVDELQRGVRVPVGTLLYPYLMQAPSPSDVLGLGVVFVSGLRPVVSFEGAFALATTPSGTPYMTLGFDNIPRQSSTGSAISFNSFTIQFNGATPGRAEFQALPSSCAKTATTATAVTYAGATGSATDSYTTSGCPLPYAPTLSGSAARGAGGGVQLTATISTAAAPRQGTARSLILSLPSGVALDRAVSSAACAASPVTSCSSRSAVGTISAVSPLFGAGSPLTGTIYATRPAPAGAAVGLTAAITKLGARPLGSPIVLSGGATGGTISLTGIPDFPLSKLGLTVSALAAACSPESGTLRAAITEQPTSATEAGPTVSTSARIAIPGCRRAGRPTLTGASLAGVGRGKPRLRFRLAAGEGAPLLRSFTVALPHGLRFVAGGLRDGVRVAAGEVRSARLSHGKLVIALVKPVGGVRVTLGGAAIARRSRVGREPRLVVAVTDTSGHATRLTHVFRRVS